jgi:hypothetical protein
VTAEAHTAHALASLLGEATRARRLVERRSPKARAVLLALESGLALELRQCPEIASVEHVTSDTDEWFQVTWRDEDWQAA